MNTLKVRVVGISQLILNNPRCVDRFDKFSKEMAKINAKKTRRTDQDYLELRKLEIASKIYFDDEVGVYAPASWLAASIAKQSFHVCKVSKANIRGAVFIVEQKLKLNYEGMNKVKTVTDIIGDPKFHHLMILPQASVRLAKNMPIFDKWNFEATIEYDPKIIDPSGLEETIEHGCKYGGFGDFRPTFGRANVEVTHV